MKKFHNVFVPLALSAILLAGCRETITPVATEQPTTTIPEATVTPSAAASETPEPIETPEVTETPELVIEDEAEPSKESFTKEEVFAYIKTVGERNFDDAKIIESPDTPGIYYLQLKQYGFAERSSNYNMSLNYNEYLEMKQGLQALCKACNEALDACDIEGQFVVCIVNDINPDKILFATLEDQVVSSVFE